MELKNKKIAAVINDIFEDLELWYPVIRLREAGAEVVLAGEKSGNQYTGKNGLPARADIGYDDLNADEFDGIIIPGGYAPDKIRRYPKVLEFVKQMDDSGKPIGIICHAGWVTISADILKERQVTSVGAIKDDMINAGANWVDEPVVTDKNLVSSRTPDDLPDYMKAYLNLLK
ncbi:type 1 glutamine amidotransferase domain-containing protein [Marinilabilia sp.]|uniref:type 1 glutamine amidotransferase domain-containing protein n=1 Tax=Marinilabilia sp. TaxID=2021252 RepID=UPI0025C07286|nr:type 1 glutamine amidotransferase domain-containing protein [Marinilabilia sp.]